MYQMLLFLYLVTIPRMYTVHARIDDQFRSIIRYREIETSNKMDSYAFLTQFSTTRQRYCYARLISEVQFLDEPPAGFLGTASPPPPVTRSSRRRCCRPST
jgi:hypothetical protein